MNESLPSLTRVSAQDVIESRIEIDVVFLDILEKFFSTQHLCDSHQLNKYIPPPLHLFVT